MFFGRVDSMEAQSESSSSHILRSMGTLSFFVFFLGSLSVTPKPGPAAFSTNISYLHQHRKRGGRAYVSLVCRIDPSCNPVTLYSGQFGISVGQDCDCDIRTAHPFCIP